MKLREHIRRVSRLAVILLANMVLLAALLVVIEGLSSYAFFLRDLVPRLRESNLSHTEYDPEIGWVGLPNVDIKDMYGPGAHLRTNLQGFRNAKDFQPKPDSDVRRIVCSGDSVTFGEHVGNDQTFCHVLAELDPKLEPINMGQVGYGVDQAYLWYKRDADDLEVDVHILAFITHDFMRMQYDKFMGIPRPVVVLEDGKPVVTNAPISESAYAMPTWLAETLNSADGLRTVKLANKVRKRLNLAPRKVPGAWDARGAEEVKVVVAGLFEDLRDYDSARSRATVLVYFPSVEELQQPTTELAYWMSVVESNARRLGIPFINFVSLFAELPAADVIRLFVDGYHFSESGNALVARELLKRLRDDPRTAGRFVAPPPSSDGQPTPDPRVCKPQTCESLGHVCGTPQDGCGGTLSCGVCGDGETCSSGTCVDASPPPPPPPTGTPYGHVTPADVGVTVGVGVVAPVPTVAYTGPQTITTPGTVIENVVIGNPGESPCLEIAADNVIVRNVIMLNCAGFHGLSVGHHPNTGEYVHNVTVEYSKFKMVGEGKTIRIVNTTGVKFQNNEVVGGQDFFWIGEGTDLRIENNYIHTATGSGTSHADGFQWPAFTDPGVIYIRGNWIDKDDPDTAPNDTIFHTGSQTVYFENNFLTPWGGYTLRCDGDPGASCIIRHNVYAQEFKDVWFPGHSGRRAVQFNSTVAGPSIYRCNRYEDGTFIPDSLMSGNKTHDITGCPSYR